MSLDAEIRSKMANGDAVRMAAGFCWKWSDPNTDGSLVNDVTIGDYARPWNAKPDAARLAKGIPKASFWASDPGGIDQVGCVYTAQGFEFDYIGVIFGNDLRYDPVTGAWIGEPNASRDHVVRTRSGARFTDNVKNAYRVLLTRGMRGCFVYFVNPDTRAYVEVGCSRRGQTMLALRGALHIQACSLRAEQMPRVSGQVIHPAAFTAFSVIEVDARDPASRRPRIRMKYDPLPRQASNDWLTTIGRKHIPQVDERHEASDPCLFDCRVASLATPAAVENPLFAAGLAPEVAFVFDQMSLEDALHR